MSRPKTLELSNCQKFIASSTLTALTGQRTRQAVIATALEACRQNQDCAVAADRPLYHQCSGTTALVAAAHRILPKQITHEPLLGDEVQVMLPEQACQLHTIAAGAGKAVNYKDIPLAAMAVCEEKIRSDACPLPLGTSRDCQTAVQQLTHQHAIDIANVLDTGIYGDNNNSFFPPSLLSQRGIVISR